MDYDTSSARSLFKQVFANGFLPLPNFDKRCMLKNWPTIPIDARQAERWSRSSRWKAMGIRVEPPLLVVDVDVYEAALAAEIAALLPAGGLERIGRAPKAAYFFRLDGEPFHRISTRKFTPDPEAAKPRWSAVEVFGGGGGGKQFGAFGPHEIDAAGNVVRYYSWPGASPADTRLDALPVILLADVYALVDRCEALFASCGWVVDPMTKAGAHVVDQLFDLMPDTLFEGDQESYDLDGLEAAAQAAMVGGEQLRVTGSFTGDPYSARSLRCRVGISHTGRVYVHDFKTGITHHPSDAAAMARSGAPADDLADILKLIGDSS